MEEVLTRLAHAARQQQEVALLSQADGSVLLAYPLTEGVAIGVGTVPESEHRLRPILRKRTERLSRYGMWLPVLFEDGSCFVVTRVSGFEENGPLLDADLFAAAVELLA